MAYSDRNHYRISKLKQNHLENSLRINERLAILSARTTVENSATNLTNFEMFLKSKLEEANADNILNCEVTSSKRM